MLVHKQVLWQCWCCAWHSNKDRHRVLLQIYVTSLCYFPNLPPQNSPFSTTYLVATSCYLPYLTIAQQMCHLLFHRSYKAHTPVLLCLSSPAIKCILWKVRPPPKSRIIPPGSWIHHILPPDHSSLTLNYRVLYPTAHFSTWISNIFQTQQAQKQTFSKWLRPQSLKSHS